jgi:hypothetical protein
MNILWYFLTFLFGAIGVLSLLRSVELIAVGAGIKPVQIGIAAIFLLAGWQCLKKARAGVGARENLP